MSSLLAEVNHMNAVRPGSTPGSPGRNESRSRLTANDDPLDTLIYFSLRPRRARCLAGCLCRCHVTAGPDHSWTLPRALQGVLGSIFIGYSGFPMGRSACDVESCSKGRRFQLQVTYVFPLWFLHSTWHAFVEASTTGSFSFGLTARRRMPYAGTILCLAQEDEETFKSKLKTERASFLDVLEYDGSSLLHLALDCHEPNIGIIRHLLQNGADTDYENDYGQTPQDLVGLAFIRKSRSPEILTELEALFPISRCIDDLELTYIQKIVVGTYPIALWPAIQALGPGALQIIHERDRDGATALHLAARRDDVAAVKTLLYAGARVNDPTKLGRTPLHMSLMAKEALCLDILLDSGADIGAVDDYGWTVLHVAAYVNHLSAVKKLLSRGVDVNQVTTEGGWSPLSIAAQHGSPQMVECLYASGGILDSIDKDGDTPLICAVYNNSHESQSLLIRLGASLFQVNSLGNTLLHIAAATGDSETMAILSNQKFGGLRTDTTNKAGLTPLQVFEQRQGLSSTLKDSFNHLVQTIEAAANDEYPVVDDEGDIFEDALEDLNIKESGSTDPS
jgi:ankyrin repeat protein